MGTKKSRSGQQFNPKGVTQGNTLICPSTGDPIDCITDTNGKRRLAVDAAISLQNVSIQVDLDYNEDSVFIGDPNTGNTLLIQSDGSIDANIEVDANDGDNIAISAHPEPIFDFDSDTITSANFEEIYSYASTNTRTRVSAVKGTIETVALVRLKINGTIVDQYHTSPTNRNFKFKFEEHRPLSNTDVLTVEAQVDRFFSNKSPYATFTTLEGYLR